LNNSFHFSIHAAAGGFRDDFIGVILERGDFELVQRADKAGGRETGDFSGFPLRHCAGFISHATCHLPLDRCGEAHFTHKAIWDLAQG